ncbi:MAG: LemA family protein [bacterium]|nr:LemA family protein [bacterium]
MELTTIILIVVAVLVFWVVLVFNSLIRMRNRVKEAASDIEVQSKRRFDLIPNLIETVKGYAKHEEGVLTKVTEARTNAMQAQGSPAEKAKQENMLSETLKSLFAVSENYPDLKANTNFLELQRELSDTENKMMAARRFYNSAAKDLMDKIQMFPSNIIAGMFGFKQEKFFETTSPEEKEAVKVEF